MSNLPIRPLPTPTPGSPAAVVRRSPRHRALLAALACVAVALCLSACGARAARREANPTTTTVPAATSTSSTATPAAAPQTDDIESDLATVQSDLDGAAQDLRDGPTEATADTRG